MDPVDGEPVVHRSSVALPRPDSARERYVMRMSSRPLIRLIRLQLIRVRLIRVIRVIRSSGPIWLSRPSPPANSGRRYWLALPVILLALPSPARADAGPGMGTGHPIGAECCLTSRVSARDSVSYAAPIPGRLDVVTTFQPPPTPYAAGHRGVDLAAPQRATVFAAGAGLVRFAGQVAGRGVVVIAHPDGLSTEYEPVTPVVKAGAPVMRGQPIGQLSTGHAACVPGVCLHWGARRDQGYLDPLSLLQPLGVVRLVPWD
ncbi:MAG: Peptidase [Frankiales bacterium]|nr:Peptidase [Frankiales bacterium]